MYSDSADVTILFDPGQAPQNKYRGSLIVAYDYLELEKLCYLGLELKYKYNKKITEVKQH